MSRLRQDGSAADLTGHGKFDAFDLDEIESTVGDDADDADDVEELADTDSDEQALDESTLLGIED